MSPEDLCRIAAAPHAARCRFRTPQGVMPGLVAAMPVGPLRRIPRPAVGLPGRCLTELLKRGHTQSRRSHRAHNRPAAGLAQQGSSPPNANSRTAPEPRWAKRRR